MTFRLLNIQKKMIWHPGNCLHFIDLIDFKQSPVVVVEAANAVSLDLDVKYMKLD